MAGTNTDLSLPLASIFKLYVLYAVSDAIKAGTVSWDDQLTVTDKGKAVGSSMDLPVGAQISVRTAAEKMIATSDNMATDMLIERVGPQAVDDALVAHRSSRPGRDDAVPDHVRAVHRRLGPPGPPRAVEARHAARTGPSCCSEPIRLPTNRIRSARTCRPPESARNGMAALKTSAGYTSHCRPAQWARQHPSRRSWTPRPGINLDRNEWPYLAAKAGGLPGDLTFSWYAVDKTGQPWVVSFQLNWPRDHGPALDRLGAADRQAGLRAATRATLIGVA